MVVHILDKKQFGFGSIEINVFLNGFVIDSDRERGLLGQAMIREIKKPRKGFLFLSASPFTCQKCDMI
jgi:hypothetical protein